MRSILRFVVLFCLLINLPGSDSTGNLALITSDASRGSLRGIEGIQISKSENQGDLSYTELWSENQLKVNKKNSDGADRQLRHLVWVQDNQTMQARTTDSYVNTVSSSATLIGQSCNLMMRWTKNSYWQEGEFVDSITFFKLIYECILTNLVVQ